MLLIDHLRRVVFFGTVRCRVSHNVHLSVRPSGKSLSKALNLQSFSLRSVSLSSLSLLYRSLKYIVIVCIESLMTANVGNLSGGPDMELLAGDGASCPDDLTCSPYCPVLTQILDWIL